MIWYIIKMLALLPLLGLMIWGSLWLTKRIQTKLHGAPQQRRARLVETAMIAPGMRLAVVEFGGKSILIGASRGGLSRLGEAPIDKVENVSHAPLPNDGPLEKALLKETER